MSTIGFSTGLVYPNNDSALEKADRMPVATHCLYPSNASVTVYVTGGERGAVVSDEGGAIGELTTHNRVVPEPDKFLMRFCRANGLKAKGGKIYSPVVNQDQLMSAVLFVANASAAAARAGLNQFKLSAQRNLRKELSAVLARHFTKDVIEAQKVLVGQSSRTYRFDQIVRMTQQRLLVIDAVLPDANSINSHAIAHLDIKNLGDPHILQRLVYDDEHDWDAADLNLLQMAATIVPFSRVGPALERIAGTHV